MIYRSISREGEAGYAEDSRREVWVGKMKKEGEVDRKRNGEEGGDY